MVSIHTPAWGVTFKELYDEINNPVSIHTPAWGVTGYALSRSQTHSVSIHTPAWGVTSINPKILCSTKCFNPHSRVGSDELLACSRPRLTRFQSTLPRGE